MSVKHVIFYLLSILVIGCSNIPTQNIENIAQNSEQTAYLTLKLDQNSHLISKITLHHVEKNIDYELSVGGRTGTSLVLPIPMGNYYLRKVTTQYQDALAIRLSKPSKLMTFKENNIYYIGDISLDLHKLYVNFSKAAVGLAMKTHPEIFKDRQLFVYNHLLGNSSTASLKLPRVSASANDPSRDCISCSE